MSKRPWGWSLPAAPMETWTLPKHRWGNPPNNWIGPCSYNWDIFLPNGGSRKIGFLTTNNDWMPLLEKWWWRRSSMPMSGVPIDHRSWPWGDKKRIRCKRPWSDSKVRRPKNPLLYRMEETHWQRRPKMKIGLDMNCNGPSLLWPIKIKVRWGMADHYIWSWDIFVCLFFCCEICFRIHICPAFIVPLSLLLSPAHHNR